MTGGSQESSSSQTSKPITPEEQAAFTTKALEMFGSIIPGLSLAPNVETRDIPMVRSGGGYGTGEGPETLTPSIPEGWTDAGNGKMTRTNGFTANTSGPSYKSPEYKGLGLGPEGYQGLQNSITEGYTAPIRQQLELDRKATDQDLSKRGLYNSGFAVQAQDDLSSKYAPALAKAGADATSMRYGFQSNELAQQNAFNTNEASKTDNSQWNLANYLKDLYLGGKGQNSTGSSSSSGWSFGLLGK